MRKQYALGKAAAANGKIILIGVDQNCNTISHNAEERMENPYRLSSETIDGVVIVDDKEMVVSSRLHVWKYLVDFNIINSELERLGCVREGKIGNAKTYCLNAKAFLDQCIRKIEQERFYFCTSIDSKDQ
jgi:aminoglycoside N3'-acetyltransferase